MAGKSSEKLPYRRRYGLIKASNALPDAPRRFNKWQADGGEDAPLTPRGRTIFRYSLLGIFVVFVVLTLVTASGH
jgi:hypothetical protein